MTPSTICALLALAASPADGARDTIYSMSRPFEPTVRAQSPYYESPSQVTTPLGTGNPWSVQPAQYGPQDPFLTPGGPMPQGSDAWWLREPQPLVSGLNGPQPYRFGWRSSLDAAWMPEEATSNGQGDFGIFELDLAARNTGLIGPGYVFTHGPEIGFRSWIAPTLITGEELPNSVFHLGWDFEVATPAGGTPWSFVAGVTPSVNTDFERNLGSDAVQLDARVAAIYQANPSLQYVLGVQYWDRVDDMILPWAGLVFTPDQRSEYRLMFPESRLSYYVGNIGGDDKWLYVSAGYHVEAYEIELQSPFSSRGEQIQFSDWRAMLGLRSENSLIGAFIEGGFVFEREVEFGGGTPGFEIDDGFILRGGLRF